MEVYFQLINDAEGVQKACDALKTEDYLGFDTETTALDPYDGIVRLVQLSNGNDTKVIDLKPFADSGDLNVARGQRVHAIQVGGHAAQRQVARVADEDAAGIGPSLQLGDCRLQAVSHANPVGGGDGQAPGRDVRSGRTRAAYRPQLGAQGHRTAAADGPAIEIDVVGNRVAGCVGEADRDRARGDGAGIEAHRVERPKAGSREDVVVVDF